MKKVEIREMHLDEVDKRINLSLLITEKDINGNLKEITKKTYSFEKNNGIEPVKEFFNEYNLNENILIDFIDSIWNQGFMEQTSSALIN